MAKVITITVSRTNDKQAGNKQGAAGGSPLNVSIGIK